MKLKRKKNNDIIYLIIILLVTILVLSKLFINIRYGGHDTIFHVTNIIKLSESISFNNIFGVDLITYEFNKFGYGIWLFYPRLPHLLVAYTHLIVKDIYLSMKIIYFITTLLSGIVMYYLSKKIFHDKKIALLSSLIYLTVPYHICEIYIRDAVAENFMFMVLPMIFLGLYYLKDNDYFKFYIFFILGYIIGINSHLGSMFFYTLFIGLFILYYRKEFFQKDRLKALIISTFIVTGVCLSFLGPLLEHKIFGSYRVFTEAFSTLEEVQTFSLDFKNLYLQEPLYNKVAPYFNISTLVLFGLSLFSFLFNKKDNFKKEKKIFLLLIILLINFICSKVIWEYLPSLFISIQFPWRLLIFMILFVALFSPLILMNKGIPKKIKNLLVLICSLIIIFEGIGNISYYRDFEISIEEAANSEYVLGYQKEYFPVVKADDLYIFYYNGYNYKIKDYEFRTNNDTVSIEIIDDSFPNMIFIVDNVKQNVDIEFPRIFYFGYQLLDEDGENVKLNCNEYGMLEANITKNGRYELKYVKSIIHRLSDLISLLTVLTVIGILVVKYIKWKKRK